jgi:hypothetical protein
LIQALLKVDSDLVSNPSWEAIRDAILRIEPNRVNTVMLQGLDEELPWLTVSGHFENRYYVTVELRPVKAFVLLSTDQPDDYVEVTFPFRQSSMICRNNLASIDVALQATRYYFEMGGTDPSLAWEKSGSGPQHCSPS